MHVRDYHNALLVLITKLKLSFYSQKDTLLSEDAAADINYYKEVAIFFLVHHLKRGRKT